jgi:hypothetical protein
MKFFILSILLIILCGEIYGQNESIFYKKNIIYLGATITSNDAIINTISFEKVLFKGKIFYSLFGGGSIFRYKNFITVHFYYVKSCLKNRKERTQKKRVS